MEAIIDDMIVRLTGINAYGIISQT